jgi:hypothetical protein
LAVDGKHDVPAGLLKVRQQIGDALPDLLKVRHELEVALRGLTGYAYAALAVAASIAIAAVVAWQATREAIRARYPRILLVVQWLPVIWCFATILLTLAARNGIASPLLVSSTFKATFWITGAAMVLAILRIFASGFAERMLSIPYVCGAIAISAVFAVAWFAGMPATSIEGILWLALAILTVSVLAPWSLSRARHT